MKNLILTSFIIFIGTSLYCQETIFFEDKSKAISKPEKLVNSILASISGPVGQDRDWVTFRNAFHPTARLSVLRKKDGKSYVEVMYLEEFIANAKSNGFYKNSGFSEKALKNTILQYGNLVHVFQAYHGTTPDGKVNIRGINSYQLANESGEWKIVNLIWQGETAEFPLPVELGG